MLSSHEDVVARSTNYSNTICPHCLRKFNARAAERHIPICKNTINKAKPLSEFGTRNTLK